MKRALSLLLVFVLILSSTLIFASCGKDKKDGEGFDFTKEKMKNYISLDRADYIGVEVEAEIYPEITEDDVDGYVEYILTNSVEKTVYTDKPIEEGDTVAIYFRGELDGVDFEGGSNYADPTPADLVIGSGTFIDGFEDGLIGVVPNETSFTKIDSGKVKADYIAYVSYTYTYLDESGAEKTGEVKDKRIDLANPKASDAIFVDKIVGQTVGTAFTFDASYDVTNDGEEENASFTMKVKYATMEEAVAVKATFPDPYKSNEELSGKEATFYVIVKSLSRVELPELTEDVITNTIKYKSENGTKGEALIAEFRNMLKEELVASRKATVEQTALENLLLVLYDKATVKEYPAEALEEAIAYYKTSIAEAFTQYSQQYSDFPYKTEEEFAPDFFGSDYDKTYNLEANIEKIAKKNILMNMVDNYLIQEEKIKYENDKEREDTVNALIESFIYNYYYTYGQQVTKEQVLEAYGEDYFAQAGLYNKLSAFLLENITIKEVIIEEDAETETEAE